uniref:Uncharacterized protein n=1 Tax=Plectus sambesii TaxID=2011161 RepID=A0A914UI11_9BILA
MNRSTRPLRPFRSPPVAARTANGDIHNFYPLIRPTGEGRRYLARRIEESKSPLDDALLRARTDTAAAANFDSDTHRSLSVAFRAFLSADALYSSVFPSLSLLLFFAAGTPTRD